MPHALITSPCRVLCAICVLSPLTLAAAEPAPVLELRSGKQVYQGKAVAHNEREVCLVQRDGRLRMLKLTDVDQFRKVSERFEKASTVELRGQLQREFGREFEVISTGHYVVCGRSGQVQQYGQLFEDLYRSFHGYFSVRGFKMAEPEFPLAALVFPNQAAFADYAKKDGVQTFKGLQGYYLIASNRIALFDPGSRPLSALEPGASPAGRGDPARALFPESPREPVGILHALPLASRAPRGPWFATSDSEFRDTIVHEATHQMAFNLGIHSRVAENPQWVVEGLAMLFEAPGIRDAELRHRPATRINRERLAWFGSYRKSRRARKSLADFVASDQLFAAAILDAYSEAWALSFFLVETRPSAYGQYLRRIAARPPLTPYPAAERLEDFKQSFGSDLPLLEAAFLRFLDDLQR